jgi:hypothetical protein
MPLSHLPKLHYTRLGPLVPTDPRAKSWDVYRRGVGQWLAEGRAGKHVVIHDEQVVGFYDSFAEGDAAAERRFPNGRCLVYEVREWEPTMRNGYIRLCRE